MRARLARLAIDGSIALASFLGACWAVVDQPVSWWLSTQSGRQVLALGVLYAVTMVVMMAVGRLDRRTWCTVSARDVGRIIRLTVVGALLFLSLAFLISRAEELPRAILLIAWFVTAGGMATGRLIARAMSEGWFWDVVVPFRMKQTDETRPPVIVIGPANRVEKALFEMREYNAPYRTIGVVLEESSGSETVLGARVLGATDQLETLIDSLIDTGREATSLVFVDSPTTIKGVDESLLAKLRQKTAPILRLPKITELTEADRTRLRLRKVRLEELLSRPPVVLQSTAASIEGVRGKRIMVTGAGGSIGSELCRQLAALGCDHLTLLDIAETPLFEIDRELASNYPSLSRRAALGDVRDRGGIAAVIAQERPERIFHAAALKHVSLMETHPAEAVLTNVVGTANVAWAARENGVRQMVLVSTDKAVKPANVMGATKRLAEAVVRGQSAGGQSAGGRGATQFSVVRFGNVLNSNGSVAPIFRAQIEAGGPVTVTHPDVERYFMTIPEAVQLLLHAANVAEAREESQPGVFVLEMGQPIKIIDLANRMIELLAPPDRKQKIAIELIGLQPGEKLSEELVDEDEETIYSTDGVIEVQARNFHPLTLAEAESLGRVCAGHDSDVVRARLFEALARVRGREGDAAPAGAEVVRLGAARQN